MEVPLGCFAIGYLVKILERYGYFPGLAVPKAQLRAVTLRLRLLPIITRL